ncbi:MAG: hypothetical protein H7Y86_12675 [Rhizobacter sp.]|nr:hypothetical protein [Ferruginibacter sp.]
MKKVFIATLAVLFSFIGYAQQKADNNKNQFVDIAGTVGNQQGSVAASYVYNWKFGFGKKKNWEVGIGARLTSSFGTKLEYTTAGPAKFTRTSTTPFLIVFAGQRPENWDTLTVQRTFVNALNITANFGYNFTSKWSGGFNIDLIGASFGRKSPAVFVSNGITTSEPSAKPTAFNILLTGDHDRGSLNSEFFVKYKLNDKWAVRGVYQFLFTEHTTPHIEQLLPDGTSINRFRNKSNNFGIGVSYQL